MNTEVTMPLLPTGTISVTKVAVRGLERPAARPRRRMPGKRKKKEKRLAMEMKSQPRREMREHTWSPVLEQIKV